MGIYFCDLGHLPPYIISILLAATVEKMGGVKGDLNRIGDNNTPEKCDAAETGAHH